MAARAPDPRRRRSGPHGGSGAPGGTAARSRAARFAAAEDGAFGPLAAFMAVGILMAVGLGISVQQAEVNRSRLQNTLDTAVLAAADLDQVLDSKSVIEDHFARAGLGEFLTGTQVVSGINSRTVSASAAMDLQTFFMIRPDNWVVQTSSEANETVESVEISLVLDISGSMRFDDRITPLRAAAKSFVDVVMAGNKANDTTVSIVPYAGQVNPGPALFEVLGGTRDHDHSSCLFLEASDFGHTGLPKYSARQVPHFMKWKIDWATMDWGWCPSDETAILPLSSDPEALKTFIDTMRLHDGTGTQVGMKWGLALLDPASEPALDVLFPDTAPAGADATWAPATGTQRPLGWSAASSKKFIVLMTDGNITDQFEPKYTGFRDIDDDDEDNEPGDVDDIDGIDHDLLNAKVETDRQTWIGGAKRVVSRADNLRNFYAMCDMAKEKGVIIYTIAFEANSNAADEMRNCASTPSHFYEVDQLEVAAAFSSIARQITQLRLTQ